MSSENAFTFLPQGAIIQELRIAGQNVVQGFPTAEPYQTVNSAYFGETIGRVANRVSGAKINSLNGKSYKLAANNGPNSLHGGPKGWGKQIFEGPKPVDRDGKESVLFTYLSKDGEEGYPGTVEIRVWYTAAVVKDAGIEKTQLEVEYEVELVGDEVEETSVAVTNHRYAKRVLLYYYFHFVLTYGVTVTSTSLTATPSLGPRPHLQPTSIWRLTLRTYQLARSDRTRASRGTRSSSWERKSRTSTTVSW